jgi:hypothetical protein
MTESELIQEMAQLKSDVGTRARSLKACVATGVVFGISEGQTQCLLRNPKTDYFLMPEPSLSGGTDGVHIPSRPVLTPERV